MTLAAAIEGHSASPDRVNRESNAKVKLDAAADALRRALAATAGSSNVIADRISTFGKSGCEFDFPYKAFAPGTGAATSASPDDYLAYVRKHLETLPLASEPNTLVIGLSPEGIKANLKSMIESLALVTTTPVNVNPVSVYGGVRRAAIEGRATALARISKDLDTAAAVYAQQAPKEVVGGLSDAGVGQLTIARALGVTPTAVRKWRRGDPPKAEHRGRLAQFAALHSSLADSGMHDPAGWLDIPVSSESTVTPLDLFARGRSDLAVLLGARLMDPQEALDMYDPSWRQSSDLDPDYEVVMLEDGSRSAVPRRGGAS